MASIGQSRPLAPAVRSPNMRTPLFIFGVALALLAFLVMFAFGVVFVSRAQTTGSVPVVVAKSQIDARTVITADMLTMTSLPASAVPPNTFLHISDLAGAAAVVTIYKGQAVSANLVAKNYDQLQAGAVDSFLPIPKGYVALTLPTSEQQGVGGYIAQGDYIDVIASINTAVWSPVRPRTVTHTVFNNVYVIRVGPQTVVQRQSGQSQGVSSSITVVMSLCDANYMNWLLINATLRYALLAKDDYAKAPPPADAACPPTTAPNSVGNGQVDARWRFTAA